MSMENHDPATIYGTTIVTVRKGGKVVIWALGPLTSLDPRAAREQPPDGGQRAVVDRIHQRRDCESRRTHA